MGASLKRWVPHFSIHLVGQEINFSPSLDAKLYNTDATNGLWRFEEGRIMSVSGLGMT